MVHGAVKSDGVIDWYITMGQIIHIIGDGGAMAMEAMAMVGRDDGDREEC